jgi:thiamine-phosphate pyrophosphorylase
MAKCQPVPIPRLVLLSDARNDAALPNAIARLPRGSAFVFRHYHLASDARTARFRALARICRAHGVLVLASRPQMGWRLDGVYGAPRDLSGTGLRLATAHSFREIRKATTAKADAILLSPVFPTRTHPGGKVLGAVCFLMLARQSPIKVLALGGMTGARSRRLGGCGWAAIDGLST